MLKDVKALALYPENAAEYPKDSKDDIDRRRIMVIAEKTTTLDLFPVVFM
jgi:hypothetical protein